MQIVYTPLIAKFILDKGLDLRLIGAAITKAAGIRTHAHVQARVPGWMLDCEIIHRDSVSVVNITAE